jgi:hypothetical protein
MKIEELRFAFSVAIIKESIKTAERADFAIVAEGFDG